tara:strand:+ start:67 stop:1422 length:1356 start_codon:yes stop_codon:yes gene_type:complete
MATYSGGSLSINGDYNAGKSTGVNLSTRRLYDFSDRVAELSPEESPFFVYLSKVAKVPTSDSTFRFLEDRTKISITDRSFLLETAATAPSAGGSVELKFHTSGGANVAWLIPGMVVTVGDTDDSTAQPEWSQFRLDTVVQTSSSVTTCQCTSIVVSGSTTLTDESKCTVIGTSFEEGTGAPDVWSQKLDHDYGQTQIFKTACEMSNTARATVYRGYADEWARIWNLKLREHKIDIERAMLFGMRSAGAVGSQNYTDGVVGHIIANSQSQLADEATMSYTEDKGYLKTITAANWTYDDLLSDFEVIFDPARGGSSSKLGLASLPVVSHFNKIGNNSFVDASMGVSNGPGRYNFERSDGAFGHKIMKIETIHGDLSMVKEPLFRGMAAGFLALVDLDHVSYRPLVGNGINRDTSITTNVQQADEDLRKDLILTEAGLEVSLPETHALIHLQGV